MLVTFKIGGHVLKLQHHASNYYIAGSHDSRITKSFTQSAIPFPLPSIFPLPYPAPLTGGRADQTGIRRRPLQWRRLTVGPLQRLFRPSGAAPAPALGGRRGPGPQLAGGRHRARQGHRDRGGGHQRLALGGDGLVGAGGRCSGDSGGICWRRRGLPVTALWMDK